MSRIHAFEFLDQAWFPSYLRDALTDFLSFVGALKEDPYIEFTGKLRQAMERMDEHTLLDLCSGASGPVVTISRILREREGYRVETKLSDLYPNISRFERAKQASGGAVDYITEPVDATRVPEALEGFRIMVNGFHHFRPEMAQAIVADAVKSRRGIAVLEVTGRSFLSLLSTAISPLTFMATAPLIKPRKPGRLALTYLLPVLPLVTLWDGMVSCLRVYSPDELRGLVDSLPPNDYAWDIGLLRFGETPLQMTYLIGAPR